MRIKSSYTDYYDYVGQMFNDQDGLVTYVRDRLWDKPLPTVDKIGGREYKREVSDSPRRFNTTRVLEWRGYLSWRSKRSSEFVYEFENLHNSSAHVRRTLLFFCGKPFFIEHVWWNSDFNTPKPTDFKEFRRVLSGDAHKFWLTQYERTDPGYAEYLTQLVGHPVFEVVRHDYSRTEKKNFVEVSPLVPRLNALQFESVMPAEQCYQEIAQYLGTMQRNPADPKNNQTQVEKIQSHGFDLNQSFRHRK